MFTDSARADIDKLRFEPDATVSQCLIPLGSILWSDELPAGGFTTFAEEKDRNLLIKLFAIRISIWDGETITEDDSKLFNEARAAFSNWPLFHRLDLDSESRAAHLECQNSLLDFFAILSEHADEFFTETGENGVSKFSAIINLQNEDGPQ